MLLKGKEKRVLRATANTLKPVVYIGKSGLDNTQLSAIEDALENHELIKIKFLDYKEQKKELCAKIEECCGCALVGLIGHIATFYREHPDEGKRKIDLMKLIEGRHNRKGVSRE
jgi:RNA-binding protein